jgi:hypothetical protein
VDQSLSGAPGQAARGHTPDWVVLTLVCVAQFMVLLDSNYHQ